MNTPSQHSALETELEARSDAWDKAYEALETSLGRLGSFVNNLETTIDKETSSRNDLFLAQRSIFRCASALQNHSEFLDELCNFVKKNAGAVDSYLGETDQSSGDPRETAESSSVDHNNVIDEIKEEGLDEQKTFLERVQGLIDTLKSQWNLSGETALRVPQTLTEDISGEEMDWEGTQGKPGEKKAGKRKRQLGNRFISRKR